MRLKGKTVGVLVERQYQELEVWYPLLRVIEGGAEGILIGPAAGGADPRNLGYPGARDRPAERGRAETPAPPGIRSPPAGVNISGMPSG